MVICKLSLKVEILFCCCEHVFHHFLGAAEIVGRLKLNRMDLFVRPTKVVESLSRTLALVPDRFVVSGKTAFGPKINKSLDELIKIADFSMVRKEKARYFCVQTFVCSWEKAKKR
jgi:hypothetical protein